MLSKLIHPIGLIIAALAASTVQAQRADTQPVIDMHRHTPWPGDSDAEGIALIRKEMSEHNVVAAALFITGREDVTHYVNSEEARFLLSPMFPCPALTKERKWCFVDSDTALPDLIWLEEQLAARKLGGLGELVFNYAGLPPHDPAMAPVWALAAKYDVPVFVHSGRGPFAGQGPRRHDGCCPQYNGELGNPDLLRAVLNDYPALRVSLQHVGFDFLEETIALMRDFPSVYVDMSVLNSVGPRGLHDAALRRLVEAGLSDRIMLGSDDQDLSVIKERIDGTDFLTPAQRRGIYYDNAAKFLRLDAATIASDYARLVE